MQTSCMLISRNLTNAKPWRWSFLSNWNSIEMSIETSMPIHSHFVLNQRYANRMQMEWINATADIDSRNCVEETNRSVWGSLGIFQKEHDTENDQMSAQLNHVIVKRLINTETTFCLTCPFLSFFLFFMTSCYQFSIATFQLCWLFNLSHHQANELVKPRRRRRRRRKEKHPNQFDGRKENGNEIENSRLFGMRNFLRHLKHWLM